MKEILKALGFMIIGAAVGLLIFGKKIQENADDQYIVKTDTVYELQVVKDTVWKEIESDKPAELVEVVKHDTVYEDCREIANLYSEERIYEQVFEDSLIEAKVSNTVFQNKLQNQRFSYRIKQEKVITVTNNIQYPKTVNLHVGMQLLGNKNYFDIVPGLMFQTKQDHAFNAGYGLLSGNFNIGYYRRLF